VLLNESMRLIRVKVSLCTISGARLNKVQIKQIMYFEF
jgi:hypothetical protein